MCIFSTKDDLCIIQKENKYNFEFEEMKAEWLTKPYSCYRTWAGRCHGYDDEFYMPGWSQQHYSLRTPAISKSCDGNPEDEPGPSNPDCSHKFFNNELCNPKGDIFFDAQCPLIKNIHEIPLSYGYFTLLRDHISKKELAWWFRVISKLRIPCSVARELVNALTPTQSTLLWLWILKIPPVEIAAILNGRTDGGTTKPSNFYKILLGTKRAWGHYTGGTLQKVQKILSKNDLSLELIQWVCQEAFNLIRVNFEVPNFYKSMGEKLSQEIIKTLDLEAVVEFRGKREWDALNEVF